MGSRASVSFVSALLVLGCAPSLRAEGADVLAPAEAASAADRGIAKYLAALDAEDSLTGSCEHYRGSYEAIVEPCFGAIRVEIRLLADCVALRPDVLDDAGHRKIRFDGDSAIYWFDRATGEFMRQKHVDCGGRPMTRRRSSLATRVDFARRSDAGFP